MKIFRKEDGIEKVYVQMNDMIYVNNLVSSIPATIFIKVFGHGITIIDDSNRFDFVSFDLPHEIEFFRNIDWIIDYNEYINLTIKELNDKYNILYDKLLYFSRKIDSMTEEELDDNCDIYKQHEQISYMLKSYIEIQKIKLGRKKLNFPWDVKEEPKGKGQLKSFFKKITKKA